jgi:hypothetical protein
VALRPQYMRRVRVAQRGDDGSEGFRWAFTRGDREIPPLDPAADLVLDLGRNIPSSVREWALTAERHPGPPRMPPDWVLAELLGTADADPAVQDRFRGLFARRVDRHQAPDPVLSGPYARFLVRSADWFNSAHWPNRGMALQCVGKTGGAFSDDGEIVGMIREGDSLATLMRMADEHRTRCEWESSVAGERAFAVLRRLADGTWDAWLTPSHAPVAGREEPTELLTPEGVSYEMALAAIFRTMGDDMPAGFGLNYIDKLITPGLPGPAQA